MQCAGAAGYNLRMARGNTKHQRCEVAVLVDAETGERNGSGQFAPDRGSTEQRVSESLRARYPRVAVVPFGPDITATMLELAMLRPRIVFNLTEWFDGDRKLDSAIAGLLEMMKLRYTGTGPAGMQLCRDKVLSKQIAAAAGVDVPRCFTLGRGQRVENPGLRFPLIVKPQFGDGSDEIGKASLVRTERELRARVGSLRSRIDDAVVCEEFIPGRDIFVGLNGNQPRVLAPLEMVVGRRTASAPKFVTYRVKHDASYRAKWRVRYRRAALPISLLRTIADFSRKAFRALQLRDYARLDFRLTDEGRLVFIEANPNPDLTPHTLGRNVCFVDIEYRDLIPGIVEAARRRCQAGAK